MSFESAVVRLILKKTSLLLSVTLMFRCSLLGWSSGLPPAPGDWSWSDMVDDGDLGCCVVGGGGVSVGGRGGRWYERRVRGFGCHQALICVRLVSEDGLFALLKTIYLTMGRCFD